MVKVVNFEQIARKKTRQKKGISLAYRNNPERYKRIGDRTRRVDPADVTPAMDYATKAFQRESQKNPRQPHEYLLLKMLTAIHDGWVHDYADDFFCYFINCEYFFMPLELNGVEQLRTYYDAFESHLPDFGLEDVTWERLAAAYDYARADFMRRYQIRDIGSLTRAVIAQSSDYWPLRPKIAQVVQSRELAFDIARQIAYYSPEILRAG